MGKRFEELGYRRTEIGPLSLRRRYDPALGQEVFEIKLGDEFLMSSAFTVSEIALADLGLAAVAGRDLDVVVGGLGLGYTARAVLAHDTVRSLVVVEMLEAVIDWHRDGLLPVGAELVADARCRFRHADFFAVAATRSGFDPQIPARRYDAILLDIDHSPDALLDDRSAGFYRIAGLQALAAHLKPGGVFGLWSNEPADPAFTARLAEVFPHAWAEPVVFHNPLQDRMFTQSVYLGRAAG